MPKPINTYIRPGVVPCTTGQTGEMTPVNVLILNGRHVNEPKNDKNNEKIAHRTGWKCLKECMSECSVMSQGSPPRNTLGLKPASAQRGGSAPDQQRASPDPNSPDPPEVTPPANTLFLTSTRSPILYLKKCFF